ncbi:hypothetical protein H0H92_005766 [Tricholoma furcatifolium]|nr:hypothetical protein H0H92_005766 [Tricholoma furcatifolium]
MGATAEDKLEIQDKLRNEVTQALGDHLNSGDVPYNELMSLPFLDAVCRETLRLYPPLTFVTRVATKDSTVPLSTPVQGLDGRQMDSILVPTGTKIFVSIYGINRDPALWGLDSSQWRPERWLTPLPGTLLNAHIPGVYPHLFVEFLS